MKFILTTIFMIMFAGILAVLFLYAQIRFDADKIIHYSPKLTTQIYDRNGELIANLFDEENRLFVEYKEIPARVIEALVATEDTSFFEHSGINLEAIFRALVKDLQAMKMVEGASTVTQQLIKNTVLTRQKTLSRKLNEAVLAYIVEAELSKEEILERYFNHVYFGHGYYGIKTAALGYFKKNLDALSIKEIAILVGLPKAPSSYDPTRHMDLSLSRANQVVNRMYTLGWISEAEYTKATLEHPVVYDETLTRNRAPYVVDEVVKAVGSEYDDLKKGGYQIYTTVDLKLQHLAQEALKVGYNGMASRAKDMNLSELNGAMVVMENGSGNVLALVGGIDYAKSSFNRATQSKRQPGSSFKPFIYQKALDWGYSPLSEIPDISRTFVNSETDEEWKPKNYENDFEGLITLKEALVHSRNLATINLLSILGLDSVYKELKKDGFKSLSMDLTLALGSFGISPLEFSSFYSMFPNYGVKTEPLLVKKVINRDGVEKVYETKSTTVTTPEQSFLMIDMMREVVKRGTGRNAQVAGIEIAGKTGTTNSNVDTWFCGFSPDIEIITWYGNDNNTPLKKGETGGRAAAPAFKYFMGKYLEMYPETTREFKMPEGVGSRKINGVIEYFTEKSPFPKVTIKQQQDEGGLMF
ncbi:MULTISPECIES: penicillin-binding protein 1A [Sulfurospirillum]|uniref:penicillin-binding protein 1A n=1 Tax=Sulfurospirillum TaxID=57665 RepID=UPI0005AA267C|nr:PBP1A family penicillin-binding protein [Sulfurospirillum cavolei]MCP3650695.1 PBP1A family penicillin-binding protein [Sulfurospirillum sp. DNRA8]MCR1809540.1 PBP1A family penicillin-binding protein [Sulfurospirillum sp. DNRA8]